MNVYQKLMTVQSKLKVHKGQENKFGHYKYRSCEDILEAVKPLLSGVGAILTLSDQVELIGDRTYIKAIAVFIDTEKGECLSVSAYAREDENKKGMDLAQVTGSVSSYARKYALNGLFGIDDTKDSDCTNTGAAKPEKETKAPDETEQPDKSEKIDDTLISRPEQMIFFHLTKNVEIAKKVLMNHKHTSSSQIKKSEYQIMCKELQEAVK